MSSVRELRLRLMLTTSRQGTEVSNHAPVAREETSEKPPAQRTSVKMAIEQPSSTIDLIFTAVLMLVAFVVTKFILDYAQVSDDIQRVLIVQDGNASLHYDQAYVHDLYHERVSTTVGLCVTVAIFVALVVVYASTFRTPYVVDVVNSKSCAEAEKSDSDAPADVPERRPAPSAQDS